MIFVATQFLRKLLVPKQSFRVSTCRSVGVIAYEEACLCRTLVIYATRYADRGYIILRWIQLAICYWGEELMASCFQTLIYGWVLLMWKPVVNVCKKLKRRLWLPPFCHNHSPLISQRHLSSSVPLRSFRKTARLSLFVHLPCCLSLSLSVSLNPFAWLSLSAWASLCVSYRPV